MSPELIGSKGAYAMLPRHAPPTPWKHSFSIK